MGTDNVDATSIGRTPTKWRRNEEAHAQARKSLQKPLRPEPNHWICHRLPFENPTGHRNSKRRVAKMHQLHKCPPVGSFGFRGGFLNYSVGRVATPPQSGKAQACYTRGTEVIGTRRMSTNRQ